MSQLRRAALGAALCALLLSGCGSPDGAAGGGDSPGASPIGQWILLDGAARVDGYPITLEVSEGRVSGTAACNSYSGTVSVSGSSFSVGDLAVTEMGCPQPGVHESERDFLDQLSAVSGWQIDSGQLLLTGGTTRLLFAPVQPEPDAPLAGTWRVESLISGTGPDGAVSSTMAPAHLTLVEDGTFTGRDGCNELQGRWTVDGAVLRFDDVTTTDAACPEGVGPMA